MQFKDICTILEDVQLDQLTEGVKIVQVVNSALLEFSESISITDTGLTLTGKYHIWSDEVKLKVNEIVFSQHVDLLSMFREVKQMRYALDAQSDSDHNSKSQLIVYICIVLLCIISYKTYHFYEKVEAVTPEANKELLKVAEGIVTVIEPE